MSGTAPWNDPAVRWVCEEHPDKEFPHDDCSGPGMVQDTPENRRKGYIGPPRLCRNCEWYDDGTGEARTAKNGDCLNSHSPRFQTRPDMTCPQYMPNTTATMGKAHE